MQTNTIKFTVRAENQLEALHLGAALVGRGFSLDRMGSCTDGKVTLFCKADIVPTQATTAPAEAVPAKEKRKRASPLTAEDKHEIALMWKSGASVHECARALGVSLQTVYRYYRSF